MHSTYDFEFVRKRQVKQITKLLIDAKIRQQKDMAWEMWLAKYTFMDEESFIDFNEFYQTLTVPDKNELDNESVKEKYEKFKPGVS